MNIKAYVELNEKMFDNKTVKKFLYNTLSDVKPETIRYELKDLPPCLFDESHRDIPKLLTDEGWLFEVHDGKIYLFIADSVRLFKERRYPGIHLTRWKSD